MKKIWLITKKVLFWLGIVAITLVILLLIGVEVFDRYVSSESGTRWLYSEIPQDTVEIKHTESGVRYLKIGDSNKPTLMLVHGAPGSVMDWVAFAKRKRIYDHYQLVIPDRPGYGGTKPRGAKVSIKEQANLLLDILKEEQTSAVVLGHSYGGPIAVIMGALDTNYVEKVVGVSGQYMPENEVIFYVSHFIRFRLFKFLLPRMIWVSNEEKMGHQEALKEVMPLYETIAVPVVLIHGDADSLVYYENSTYLKKVLGDKAELITMKGYDHPVHMQATDLLMDLTLKALGIN